MKFLCGYFEIKPRDLLQRTVISFTVTNSNPFATFHSKFTYLETLRCQAAPLCDSAVSRDNIHSPRTEPDEILRVWQT
jgi:hypothetical protein